MVQLDFIVMGIFALLIFAIGLTFTRVGSKNGQAFFEAGGATPWWINGLSLFISYFSAGTFVVWGSIAYKFGLVSNTIQLTMAISGLIVTLFIAAKWKKTGVATAAEYIGKRFGDKEQQFYTYMTLLLSLFTTAAVLYPVGKMVHVATDLPVNTCILIIGMIIVLYTAAGGLWAVLVTDVVQFVILSAAVLIVIPISFAEIGGLQNLVQKAPEHFFQPFNEDYTLGFMLAFIVYQTFYIGGNWSYVQRYTSVAEQKDSKKVAGIFTILYFISPVIWMLPPMIYRVINPNLEGLQTEDAYMMLIQKVMPGGLIGLVLAGMVSATSSKANTTINMAATVFAQDIYKNLLNPSASEKNVIWIARFFTLLFGVLTIVVAMWIPSAGGIVEVVLSTASIAGGALFAPIIWTLFSKRQTGFSVVTATVVSLIINLFLKVAAPDLIDLKLTRTMETVLGMGIPMLILLVFEMLYKSKGFVSDKAIEMKNAQALTKQIAVFNEEEHQAAEKQNIFGIRVIAISMAVVGAGIIYLGLVAPSFSTIIAVVGALILLGAIAIGGVTLKKNKA
ncbi:sodium:solute symporter family protein [Pedobacter xixiisoli]|uniref:Transporter, SSS family n=1 Tax=Pedobacter xixiisoli TaxID=1476464 RepID=A0A285ZQ92_9SPHI|nr:sodium:solute symporter family protein [Pedobacter xixiisoli]SOD11817.1 transporter, SSS family [Pedobacter xixiisoli]